jgi:hypothetical protein
MHHCLARGSLVAAALIAGSVALASCSSSGQRYTIGEVDYLQQGQTRTFEGGGCTRVLLPASRGLGPSGPGVGDFNVTEGTDGDAFVVRVFSDQELLAMRTYDEATLASGKDDQFSVTTHSGAIYTLRYWFGACTMGPDGVPH